METRADPVSTMRTSMRRGARLAGAALLLFVVGAAVAGPPAHAAYAGGGDGRLRSEINWISWGASEGTVIAEGSPSTATKTQQNVIDLGGGHQAVATCVITNPVFVGPDGTPSGGLKSYKSGSRPSDSFNQLYNSDGSANTGDNSLVAGLGTTREGERATFNISCSETIDNETVPLAGLVFADAEESHQWGPATSQIEYLQVQPTDKDGNLLPAGGVTWRAIDKYRPEGCASPYRVAVAGDGTARMDVPGDNCVDKAAGVGPNAVLFAEGATAANVTLQGAGFAAIAVGLVFFGDHGDAPASYGLGTSVFAGAWTDGVVASGVTQDVFAAGFGLAALSPRATSPMLGAAVDADAGSAFTQSADGDDARGIADEDAIVAAPELVDIIAAVTGGTGEYVLADVSCSPDADGHGAVAGWIDWNGDGAFAGGERSNTVLCANGAASLTWSVPAGVDVGQLANDGSYLRLRIAKNPAQLTPAGLIVAGETEDYRIAPVSGSQTERIAKLSLRNAVDKTMLMAAGGRVVYTYTIRNTGDVDLTGLALRAQFSGGSEPEIRSCRIVGSSGTTPYIADLPAGETEICTTLAYPVAAADEQEGIVTNVAYVEAAFGVEIVRSNPSTATTIVSVAPDLATEVPDSGIPTDEGAVVATGGTATGVDALAPLALAAAGAMACATFGVRHHRQRRWRRTPA